MSKINKYNDRLYWIDKDDELIILKSINNNKIINMFGEGIVKNAYQEIDVFYKNIGAYEKLNKGLMGRDINENEILHEIKVSTNKVVPSFDITNGKVIIEFVSGKVIEISTSEWGDISSIETEEKLIF